MDKLIRRTTLALILSSIVAYAAPQNTVTFYGLSVPTPSSTVVPTEEPGIEDLPDLVHDGIHFGGEIIDASAISVDDDGATYYAGVHKYSVIRNGPYPIQTVTLPTPISETITFLADATRLEYAQETGFTTGTSGLEAEVGVNCVHNVDDETSVEDGTIVCEKVLGYEGEDAGEEFGTTVTVTTTGQPVALGTVTNSEDVSQPTDDPGSAESMRIGWRGIVASAVVIGVVQCFI